MTAHWMAYCVAVGTLLALAALAAEAALHAARRPARWAWAAGLLLSLAVPLYARWTPAAAPPLLPLPAQEAAAPPDAAPLPPVAEGTAIARPDLAPLDRPLALLWGGASAAVLAALVGLAAALHLRRRRWVPSAVDGERVLLAEDTGPAVVGLFRPRIVLPRWTLDAAPATRALLLEHEREHLRAGDPRLLLLGFAAVVLLPFSPAAWWMLRRLRLAVEVDCDARVLARHADLGAYGGLLLEVGRRGGRAAVPLVAFSESTSNLERRIRIMTAHPVRAPRLRAATLAIVGAALTAAACETPGPAGPSPLPTRTEYAAEGAPEGMQPARITPREAVERYYPDVLTRGAGENAEIFFVISGEGEVVQHHRASRTPSPLEQGERGRIRIRPADALDLPPESVERIDVSRVPAGSMGPDPFALVWIQQRPEGAAARTLAPTRTEGAVRLRSANVSDPVAVETLRGHIRRLMPEVAARGTGGEPVWLVTDPAGTVVAHGSGTGEGLTGRDPATIESIEVFRGPAVRVNGHDVPVIWVRLKG